MDDWDIEKLIEELSDEWDAGNPERAAAAKEQA